MLPVVQMIYGYPGEDAESIDDTISFFRRVKFYPAIAKGQCHINLLTPLPGSPLYRDLAAAGAGRIGDEQEYLLRLDQGYYIGAAMLLNLTKFTDSELLSNKGRLEDRIKNDYLAYKLLHPSEWFRWYFRVCSAFLAVEGMSALIREMAAYGSRLFGLNLKRSTKLFGS